MTRILQVDPVEPDLETLEVAARALRDGGVVAFPTETVYGLGALRSSAPAEQRLREIKGREAEKPFSVLIASVDEAIALVERIPPRALDLIDRYWPGPLTLVLPRREGHPESIGLRLPGSPIARTLVAMAGGPLLAPSANPSGEPPAIDAMMAREYFDGRVDVILDGGPVALGQSSTVVAVSDGGFEVLREGFITRDMIQQLLGGKVIVFVCTGNTCRSPMAAALFRKHLAERIGRSPEDLEETGFRIYSAGTSAGYGSQASEHSVEVMAERGIDLRSHVARPITRELLARTDRVFTMTESHLAAVLEIGAGLEGLEERASTLSARSVSDPVGYPIEVYRQCADEIEAGVLEILQTF